jgi:hypothetical protein
MPTNPATKKKPAARPGAKQRRNWKPVFLDAFSRTANVTASAQAASIDRSSVYTARDRDPEFRQAWDRAEEEALDRLEAAAWQLALADHNPTLVIFLLKARKPTVYGENAPGFRNRLELTGAEGGPVQVDHDALVERLMEKLERMESRQAATSSNGRATNGR